MVLTTLTTRYICTWPLRARFLDGFHDSSRETGSKNAPIYALGSFFKV